MMAEEAEEEKVVVGQKEEKLSGATGSHGHDCHQNKTKGEEEAQVSGIPVSSSSSSSSDKINPTNVNKGKSCKGCLYYSSIFKSNSRNPLCVGISRSLPHGKNYYKDSIL